MVFFISLNIISFGGLLVLFPILVFEVLFVRKVLFIRKTYLIKISFALLRRRIFVGNISRGLITLAPRGK